MKKSILKLPETLKIGPINYKILHPYKWADDYARGMTHLTKGFIKISNKDGPFDQAMQRIMETFLHEIVHAIDAVFLGSVLEEDDVLIIGNSLLQVICDNNINFFANAIPKKVKVGAFDYTVLYPYEYQDNLNLDASHDDVGLTLRLGEQENKDVVKLYFLLLIIQAAFSTYCIKKEIIDNRELCFTFTTGLLSVFRDNPDLEKLIKRKS